MHLCSFVLKTGSSFFCIAHSSYFSYPRLTGKCLSSYYIYHMYTFSQRPIILEHAPNRLPKYLHIQPQTPLPDILRIQLHHFFKVRNVTSPTNLPQPGQSRPKRHPGSVMWLILFPLIYCRRPGSC